MQFVRHSIVIAFSLAALAPLPCLAQDAATTQPATRVVDPAAAEAWLDKIEAKSKELKSIQADVIYDRNQVLQGDRQRRTGKLVCVTGPPAKFAVHFTNLIVDDRADKQDRWFLFDGQWLVERQDTEKLFMKRQIVPPNAKPEQADPLRSGDGPFVLPITLEKERTLKRFSVVLEDPAKGDPANSVHLRLTPRDGTTSDYTRIDLWYDRDTLTPVRARTINDAEDESIIELRKSRINEPVDMKMFDVSEPKEEGWHVEVTPWEQR